MVAWLFGEGIFNVDTEFVRDFRSWLKTGAWCITWDCGCGDLHIKVYFSLVKQLLNCYKVPVCTERTLRKWHNKTISMRSTQKWFGLNSFAVIVLFLGWTYTTASSTYFFLVYTSLPPAWELLNGFTQPFFSGIVIPLTDSHLCGFLANVEAPYPVEHNAVRMCFLSTNCRLLRMNIWDFNAFFPQKPHGPSLPWLTALHFATPAHALWPLDLVMTQQLFTCMHD